jgi:flagellar hook assembly protein FlgD
MNARLNAGYYQVSWDGMNERGQPMASGIYIYRIQAGDFLMVRKMTLMK